MLFQGRTIAQSLISPRATAVAAYGPLVSDTREFGLNPAGLTGLRDWEFSATTYLPTAGTFDGFVFHGLTLGKKFLDRHAAAMQFSDGTVLEVVFPADGIIIGPAPTTVDSRMSYSEKFALAYAYQIFPDLSAGLSGRLRQEKVTDTQYQLVDTAIVRLPDVTHESNSWNIDLSLHWRPASDISLSILGKNLVTFDGHALPGEFRDLRLPNDPVASIAGAYSLSQSVVVSLEANSEKQGAFGSEFVFNDDYSVRAGLSMSEREHPFVYALGAGLGWKYEFLEFDISYLHFFDDRTHSGAVAPGDFDPSVITNLDFNRYTRQRISLSVAARFGKTGESRTRIDRVAVSEMVYAVSKEITAYTPFGKVYVTNISDVPVHARASVFIENLMSEPTESRRIFIIPGEQAEIPLTALFDGRLNSLTETTIRDATILVSTDASREPDDRTQARIVFHGRNAWDGKVESLRYFVKPDDPDVIRYSRDVLLENRDGLEVADEKLELFQKARILIDAFAGKLVYVNDPKLSSDHVQYPSETLDIRGGDCDDMSVWFSSLLASVGISTAFIDVVPPEDPGKSHVYLMFDTGVHPSYGSQISDNPKRYIVRRNTDGDETIWIPVETTVIARGFEEAWTLGAEEYFQDVEVNLGLVEGWVRIFDVY